MSNQQGDEIPILVIIIAAVAIGFSAYYMAGKPDSLVSKAIESVLNYADDRDEEQLEMQQPEDEIIELAEGVLSLNEHLDVDVVISGSDLQVVDRVEKESGNAD